MPKTALKLLRRTKSPIGRAKVMATLPRKQYKTTAAEMPVCLL